MFVMAIEYTHIMCSRIALALRLCFTTCVCLQQNSNLWLFSLFAQLKIYDDDYDDGGGGGGDDDDKIRNNNNNNNNDIFSCYIRVHNLESVTQLFFCLHSLRNRSSIMNVVMSFKACYQMLCCCVIENIMAIRTSFRSVQSFLFCLN